jgi:hypothetical protein
MLHWGTTLFQFGATPPGLPVVHNALESDNKNLKLFVTDHKRLAMGTFLKFLSQQLSFESSESRKNGFAHEVVQDRNSWGKAQLWLKKGVLRFICSSTTDSLKLYVPSSAFMAANPNATAKVIKDGIYYYRTSGTLLKNEHFDDFVDRASAFYTLQQLPENERMASSVFYRCSCPVYFKYATCKHSLGVSIWKGHSQVPPIWHIKSIEQLRKRGRPAKVTNCLEKCNKK